MNTITGTLFATLLLTLVMGCTSMVKNNSETSKGIKNFVITKGIR